jgi:two-component system phosphate regulon sensor histidine kinase PhoR
MVYNSRVLALLLAICIAFITTLFLRLFGDASTTLLPVVFAITFLASFLLIFIVFDFLIFREIKKI